MIPTDRPVNGYDILNLREKLGLTRDDFLFSLGTWTGNWYDERKHPERPLQDVAVALLCRWYDLYPHDVPLPQQVEVNTLYNLLVQLMGPEKMTARVIAVALGCDVSAGYRWTHNYGPATLSVNRLATMLYHKVLKLGHRAFSVEWIRNVSEEAVSRGAKNIWHHGDWPYSKKKGARRKVTPAEIEKGYSSDSPHAIDMPDIKPITGNDLLSLREKLGLSGLDFQYVLGISGIFFSKLTKERKQPLYDPTIALFARWLNKYPEDAKVPISPTFIEFFETLNTMLEGRLTYKEVAISFGKQPSAGHRWATTPAPTIGTTSRILSVLYPKIRAEGPLVWAERWRDLVDIEANARGIRQIWRHGVWGQRREGGRGMDAGQISDLEKVLDKRKQREAKTAVRLGKPRKGEKRLRPSLVLTEAVDISPQEKHSPKSKAATAKAKPTKAPKADSKSDRSAAKAKPAAKKTKR